MMSTLDALARWARERPNHTAFHCHDAFDHQLEAISYAELLDRALRGASLLRECGPAKSRVALLLPNAVEYIVAFLAAQAADMVPVPLMPMSSKKSTTQGQRLKAVISDCRPAVCITGSDELADDAGVMTVSVDRLMRHEHLADAAPVRDVDVAFIQYTSGSTSMPRGVVVRQGNLVRNCQQMSAAFGNDCHTVFGSWLPLFHDMGLIGHALYPLLLGAQAHMLRPDTFLRRPVHWLRMISEERVVFSGAPNFAFDYCVERVKEIDGLDLSSWRLAINGSEPVLRATLDRFAEKFAPAGFQRNFFQPVYGLAEATVFVTGRPEGTRIRELGPDSEASRETVAQLEHGGTTKSHIGVGQAWLDGEVLIWNFETNRPCTEQDVGEIMVRGQNCCESYFGKEDEAAAVFAVALPGRSGTYLRTGDLGFVAEGELYIVGRSKEMILVRGRNIPPQDIEEVAQASHDDFVERGGAAVEVNVNGRQRIVLIQEVKRRASIDDGGAALKHRAIEAVSEHLDIALHEVVLLQRGMLPKTTSGKIARMKSRDLWMEGRFGNDQGCRDDRAEVEALIDWWRTYARGLDLRVMDERRCIAPHVVLDLGNQGLLGLRAPKADGGSSLSISGMMKVLREIAAVDLSLASFIGVHNGLAQVPLIEFGSDQQKRNYLGGLASGRRLGSFALTEAHGGSNPRAMRAMARKRDGMWVLNGSKVWIGNASWSSVCVFFAQAYSESGIYLGVTAFLVPTDARGVRQGGEVLTLGMRSMVQNELIVEDVVLDDSAVLGRVGHGFEVASSTVTSGRLGVTNLALGCMDRCIRILSEYGRQREIASGRLIEHPIVARRLLAMHAASSAIATLAERYAGLADAQETVPTELLSSLKAVASELCWKSVDDTLQVFGGRGYDEANGIPQMLRDSRLLRIFEGPSEVLHSHVGAAFCRGDAAIMKFLTKNFTPAMRTITEFTQEVQDLYERCVAADSSSSDGLRRFVQDSVGEAVGYLMLEAASAGAPSESASEIIAHQGAVLFRRKRAELMQSVVEAVDTPRLIGDLVPLLAQLVDRSSEVAQCFPFGMNIKCAPDDDLVASPEFMPAPAKKAHDASRLRSTAPAYVKRNLETELRVATWIKQWIGRRTNRSVTSDEASFVELGMDSIDAVELVADFSEEHGIEVDPTVLWEFPNVARLSNHLVTRLDPQAPSGDRPGSAAVMQGEKERLLDLLEREISS